MKKVYLSGHIWPFGSKVAGPGCLPLRMRHKIGLVSKIFLRSLQLPEKPHFYAACLALVDRPQPQKSRSTGQLVCRNYCVTKIFMEQIGPPNKAFSGGVFCSLIDFMDYRAAKQFIVAKLRAELSEQLHYHGLHHTLDVLKMAAEIGEQEGIGTHNMVLLKTAALFHDAGFVKNKHAGHEAEGCIIARAELPKFDYQPADIETICGMIMATKIPQSPTTLLEEIICDADLDYLGRNDFYRIGNSLFEEMLAYQLITDEFAWNRLQVSFLNAHRFHTRTNKQLREPVKRLYLEELKGVVAAY